MSNINRFNFNQRELVYNEIYKINKYKIIFKINNFIPHIHITFKINFKMNNMSSVLVNYVFAFSYRSCHEFRFKRYTMKNDRLDCRGLFSKFICISFIIVVF